MTEPPMGAKAWLRQGIRWAIRSGGMAPLARLAALDRDQWMALAAYQGLVHQAFERRPFVPQVSAAIWEKGAFRSSADRKPFFSPAQRELENSSHHYGHDIQIKRHAGLPLIGAPLPWLLEHGLKVSREASFETPRPWSRGYLCMGPLRASWLRDRFGLPAIPIGPWIAYAQPLLEPEAIASLREELGSTLLVVLAHSWDQVERRMDQRACIDAVAAQAAEGGYRSVIWLRHWKDPELKDLPPEWILACNGHRSNPWFLDAMRTLLELCDGLASNAFGTHLGYGVALGKRLHWLPVQAEQDLSGLSADKAEMEAREWAFRRRLSDALGSLLKDGGGSDIGGPVWSLLDPYWGFESVRSPEQLRRLFLS